MMTEENEPESLEEAIAHEDADFREAVLAVVRGEVDALKELLAAEPSLVSARSKSEHRCTLLHYIAANDVEIQGGCGDHI